MEAPRLLAGRYRLDRVLGRGGMATVWRAHDEVLDRLVAAKLVQVGGDHPSAAVRFAREARGLGGDLPPVDERGTSTAPPSPWLAWAPTHPKTPSTR